MPQAEFRGMDRGGAKAASLRRLTDRIICATAAGFYARNWRDSS